MKRLINISLFLLLTVTCFGQLGSKVVTDTILDMSTVSGSDTLIWVRFYNNDPVSIEIEYGTLDADDATIEVGYSNTGTSHCNSDGDSFPFTLDATGNAVSGASTTSLMIIKDKWNTFYTSLLITPNSVTSGYIILKIYRL